MTDRNGVQPKKLLDSLFRAPVGSEDNFTSGSARTIIDDADNSVGIDGLAGTPVSSTDEAEYFLETPDAIYIIDQRLRRAPGGQQVVDIVIDVEDIIGAAEYEVQIAKV